MQPPEVPAGAVAADVARALAEDLGSGDASAALIPQGRVARARVVTRESMVLAGGPWFEACLRGLDEDARIHWNGPEGGRFEAGAELCQVTARARALLSGERCALNFLQTLSATATATAAYVAAVAGTGARILDTRKTLPGLRLAQKYAVRAGGGSNHRIGLFDAVMIKENHIAAAGSIAAAVTAARALQPPLPVIVEVEDEAELRQALAAGADRILLDDFSLQAMRDAVALVAGRVPLEASGGVELDTAAAIAATGVDFISVGALTKHVRAIDLSLRLEAAAAAGQRSA